MQYSIMTLIFLVLCTVTDLRRKQIWWPFALLFLVGSALIHLLCRDAKGISLLLCLLPGGLLLLTAWLTHEAIGYGDGWVVAACGAALGFQTVLEMLLLALLFAAAWSGILLLKKKAGRGDSFPFVPFLLAAHVCLTVAGSCS